VIKFIGKFYNFILFDAFVAIIIGHERGNCYERLCFFGVAILDYIYMETLLMRSYLRSWGIVCRIKG
jgi:hypothetical protein